MRSAKILVSVVTPAFQASGTIAATVASVRAQRGVAVEHIVVLDGADPVTECVARDAGALVLLQPHAGAATARNTGISAATGEWLLFLDADDVLEPYHLARLLNAAAQDDRCDLVACGYQRDDVRGKKVASYAPPSHDPLVLGQRPPGAIHAFLVRRELVQRVGGFDAHLTTNEDWDLWLRVFHAARSVATSRHAVARYHITPGSLSQRGVAMIEDSATVRARIQADPQTLPFQEAERRLETVLWNAALAIGVGRIEQVGSLAGLALPIRGLPEDEALLAEGAIDGLMVGAGMPKPALLLNWPRFDAPFGDMLRIACSTAGQPTLAFALERIVARELARASRLSRPAQLGSITVRRLSLRDVIAGVPAAPGGGATLLKLPLLRPRRLFLFEIVGEGLSGTALRQLITDQLITRLSRVLFGRRQVRTSLDATVRVFATARRLIARIRRKLYALPPDLPPALPGAQPADDTPGRGNEADWDAFFGTEDPWSYGNAYEQVKYRRTLDLLQSLGSLHGDARAIELACAEGMFTRMLAPVVGKLLATDISAVAIERAAKRCAGIDNVSFDTLDFFNADIGGPWDVIVCSEVLYYMGGPGELPGFADRVASALAPDGVFVHAHAFEVTDDPGHTGFDWNDPFSAHTISRVFRGTAGLERAAAIETDLYLIEVYRRATSSDQRSDVTPQIQPIGAELEPNLAAWVVWNGAIRVRPVLDETVRSSQVPVLMYHSISDDGPSALAQWRVSPRDFEHQLRFLRRRGFRATYPEEWDYETRRHGALRGRPILITFDDGYANFHETALPILERNGFSAHLFVVTGKVGGCADWDDTHGKPLPLMDWRALADCRARGTSFGSHLCYHRAATHLSDQALLEEATRSRAILADRLGIDATTVAPPYGATDDRVAWLCAKAGYRRLFTVEPGVASAWAQKLRTPRLEVSGDMSIGRFAEMLGVNEAEAPTKDDEPT